MASYKFGLIFTASSALMLLLMIAPHFNSALECYYSRPGSNSNVPIPTRGSVAWEQQSKLVEISGFGTPSTTTNGNGTQTCSAEQKYCLTLRCETIYGKGTWKRCDTVGLSTPEVLCNFVRAFCRDPKFYCRYCQGDLCNNEPMDDDNDNANALEMQ